jgi:predicted phage tail protein
MRATVSGTSVTLTWQRNPSGGAPTDYILYIGTSTWGTEVINGRSLGNVTSVSLTLPVGTYYARVRARNSAGTSRSNDPVSFRIGTTLAAPTELTAEWSGTQATLSWAPSDAESAEKAPSNYVLEAGSAPGLTDVAAISLGETTTFSTDVPSGVYYVRVRATNDQGDSDPTEEIVVAPPGTAEAPLELTTGGEGSLVTLSWTAPSGGTPAGYIIEAGSDPGLSDIATIRVGNVTSFSTEAPPGTYFVRVRAVNALGAGLPSNEVVVQK